MTILDEPQGAINESSVSMQPVIMKWGLISAVVGIIFQIVTMMLGMSGMTMAISGLSLIISCYLLVLAVRADRDDQLGGFASFKRVFMLSLAVILVSSLITQIFSFIYLNYLNPSAVDATMEGTRSFLEKMNMQEDQIDKAIDEATASLKSPMSIVKNFAGAVFIGAIVAAIYGAIMKKERPMFN